MTFNQLNEHKGKAYWTGALAESPEQHQEQSAAAVCWVWPAAGPFSWASAWGGTGREIPRAPCSRPRAAQQAGEMVCKTSPFSLSPTPSFLRLHFSNWVIAMKVVFSVFPLLRQCKERCRKTSASTYKKKMKQKLCLPSNVIIPLSLQTFWDQHSLLLSVQH